MRVACITFLLAATTAHGNIAVQENVVVQQSNPIRKVVSMLQAMEKKVSQEGEKEKALFDKFMCYCKNSGGTLGASVAEAEAKVPQVTSDISEGEAQLAQLKEDLKRHQTDRAAAKSAEAEATALREKEAGDFAKEKDEATSNIDAMKSAISSLEKGMSGTFLQTTAAKHLQSLLMDKPDLLTDFDRETVVSFLSGGSSTEYVPASGEITGILKEMESTMSKSLAEAEASEADSVKSYNELMSAKNKEVAALSKSIESKTKRVGELAVEIVQMKADLSDTQAALLEDQNFLRDMDKNCAQKTAEHEENMKLRGQELVALADTIKILNDDDALELFKKTLPAAGASSLIQMEVKEKAQSKQALLKIRDAQLQESGAAFRRPGHGRPGLDFIAMALQGKKVDFSKVVAMVDKMVAQLSVEQADDEHKKEYCNLQFDTTDDKKKGLEHSISDLESSIATEEEAIATLKDEVKALEKGIKALDKSVAEATEQRKEENEDFTSLMASDNAAKSLLNFAKNRLNKFYNPKQYKAEAAMAQVNLHDHAAPPPPPATAGAFKKKGEESNGVIAMLDTLVADLDKEMTEAQTTEKNSQKEYESMMNDSASKRAADSKAIADKMSAKAATEESFQSNKEEKKATSNELMAVHEYISSLHAECDWLLKYFDVRKEARTGEIESLKQAKAVLSGADFSLLQTKGGNFLGKL